MSGKHDEEEAEKRARNEEDGIGLPEHEIDFKALNEKYPGHGNELLKQAKDKKWAAKQLDDMGIVYDPALLDE